MDRGLEGCFVATVVEDLPEEARIARGTFYLYFSGKRAPFAELLRFALTGILEPRRRT